MSAPTLGGSGGQIRTRSMVNGYTVTVEEEVPSRSQERWSGGNMGSGGAHGAGKGVRVFPHLDDLIARASPQIDINVPMRTLLQKADVSAKQADTHLDFRRPDLAFIEYLTAFTILVNYVPKHKDFPELSNDRGELWRLNKGLKMRIDSQHDKFGEIRDLIKEDNARSGVRPTVTSGAAAARRPTSPARNSQYETVIVRDNKPRPSPPRQIISDRSLPEPGQGNTTRGPYPPKPKPLIQPKPQNLHGNLLPNGHRGDGGPMSPPNDGLAERFARLRAADSRVPPAADQGAYASSSRPGSAGSFYDPKVSVDMPSPSDFTPSSSVASLPLSQSGHAHGRPSGPRVMPGGSPLAPAHPPKIPLKTQFPVAMPRPPSPTYSPARALAIPTGEEAPRITTRNLSGTGARPSSLPMANTTPGTTQPESGARWRDPQPGDMPADAQSRRGRKVDLPQQTSISAQQLYDYIKRGSEELSILLIDVRSREQFDDGHIWAPSVICLEPIALRPNVSAEELQETMILSPDEEQTLFDRRDEFDLVVYYDGRGNSRESLGGLHQALEEYNYNKPLQRPPVLLRGGLDEWTDLVGEQALKTSDTAGQSGASRAAAARKAGRPLGRVPMANTRRRLREMEPLNPEEETAWLERVRGEGGVRSQVRRSSMASESARTVSGRSDALAPDDEPSFVRTYDEFLRRYPEPADLSPTMISPHSPPGTRNTVIDHPFHNFTGIRSPAHHPPPVPGSLSTPSRPPPALPKTSYSGVSQKVSYQAPALSPAPPRPSASDVFSSRSHSQVSRTGLTNFGATCYMNSVLQCLSATTPLTRYFLTGAYQRAVQRNKWGSNGVLPQVYHSLMWHLWHGEYSYIAPKTFRDFISRLNKDFENANVQHDANDFFVFLLDALHEDLNINFAQPRPPNLTPAEERRRESFPPQIASRFEWKRYSRNNQSWISNLFSGQHMSRLQCLACGFSSTSYETFNSISLEIPKTNPRNNSRTPITIYDCLRNYTSEERLSAGDAWTCPDCKCPREASKRLTLTRAPQVLVLQLKRFRSVRRGFTDKTNTFVDFPLTKLDLTPYALPPIDPREEEALRTRHGNEVMQPTTSTTPPFEYDAYGVVQHFGTLTGGHYKALIRGGGGRWLEFNDRVVTEFMEAGAGKGRGAGGGSLQERRVQTESAYLVFYVRSNVE